MGGFSSVHQTWFSTTGFNLRGGCCRLCLGMVPLDGPLTMLRNDSRGDPQAMLMVSIGWSFDKAGMERPEVQPG